MIDLTHDFHNIFSSKFYINNETHNINGQKATIGPTISTVITTWVRYEHVVLNLRWVGHVNGLDMGMCF